MKTRKISFTVTKVISKPVIITFRNKEGKKIEVNANRIVRLNNTDVKNKRRKKKQ